MVREILIWPDPRLKERALPVGHVDLEVQRLVDDLFETMYAAQGVGLAAPQVGVLKRVIVVDTSPREESWPIALIDPLIVEREGEALGREGCLSVPGESEEVTRAARIKVRYTDRDGQGRELVAEGLLAVAIQHETDHLEGVLFVDYLSALKRELIRRRMRRLKQDLESEGEGAASL